MNTNDHDGIVILNDGRVGKFCFYKYSENEFANGMNGYVDKFDKQCPTLLQNILNKLGLISFEQIDRRKNLG